MNAWDVVTTDSHQLIGGELSTTARIEIASPTATNLALVEFVVEVTAGTSVEEFTLGMFRVMPNGGHVRRTNLLTSALVPLKTKSNALIARLRLPARSALRSW